MAKPEKRKLEEPKPRKKKIWKISEETVQQQIHARKKSNVIDDLQGLRKELQARRPAEAGKKWLEDHEFWLEQLLAKLSVADKKAATELAQELFGQADLEGAGIIYAAIGEKEKAINIGRRLAIEKAETEIKKALKVFYSIGKTAEIDADYYYQARALEEQALVSRNPVKDLISAQDFYVEFFKHCAVEQRKMTKEAVARMTGKILEAIKQDRMLQQRKSYPEILGSVARLMKDFEMMQPMQKVLRSIQALAQAGKAKRLSDADRKKYYFAGLAFARFGEPEQASKALAIAKDKRLRPGESADIFNWIEHFAKPGLAKGEVFETMAKRQPKTVEGRKQALRLLDTAVENYFQEFIRLRTGIKESPKLNKTIEKVLNKIYSLAYQLYGKQKRAVYFEKYLPRLAKGFERIHSKSRTAKKVKKELIAFEPWRGR